MSLIDKGKATLTNKSKGAAAKLAKKLTGGTTANNVGRISFPSNLENEAQSTYMIIYVLDNTANQQNLATTTFNSGVDKVSYEIPAVTFLKNYAKQELDKLKKDLKDAGNYIVKSGTDWVAKRAEAEAKKLFNISDNVNVLEIKQQFKEVSEWTNKWLIPKKVVSQSSAIKDLLDPVTNGIAGYKLRQAIVLQMPSTPLKYTYNMGWEAKDTSTLNMIEQAINVVGSLGSFFQGDEGKAKREAAKRDAKDIGEALIQNIGDAITGGASSAARQSRKKIFRNPMLAFTYSCPEPRKFQYDFTLYPRNKEELYTLFKIIQMLKFYAHPEMNYGDWIRYPATFVIKFFTNGYENKWLPQTLSLGLTSIDETLTGEGGDLAFFENYFDKESGNPPRVVKLSLSFTELAIVDRDAINQGY